MEDSKKVYGGREEGGIETSASRMDVQHMEAQWKSEKRNLSRGSKEEACNGVVYLWFDEAAVMTRILPTNTTYVLRTYS